LVHGFGGADTIAFSAEFAFRGGGAGALLAGTRLGLRQFLARCAAFVSECQMFKRDRNSPYLSTLTDANS
jgi:hypothetical protein